MRNSILIVFIVCIEVSKCFSISGTKKNEFKYIRCSYLYDSQMNNYNTDLIHFSYVFHADSIFCEKADTEITLFPTNPNSTQILKDDIDTVVFTDAFFLGKIMVNTNNFFFISVKGDTSLIIPENYNTIKFNRKLNSIYNSGEIEVEKDTIIEINSIKFDCIKLKIHPINISHNPIELVYEFIDKKSLLPVIVLYYHRGIYLYAKEQLVTVK